MAERHLDDLGEVQRPALRAMGDLVTAAEAVGHEPPSGWAENQVGGCLGHPSVVLPLARRRNVVVSNRTSRTAPRRISSPSVNVSSRQ
jgi:hypothetical protein